MKSFSLPFTFLVLQLLTSKGNALLLRSTLCPILIGHLKHVVEQADAQPLDCSCRAQLPRLRGLGVRASCRRETCREGLCLEFEISTVATRQGATTSECTRERFEDTRTIADEICMAYEFEKIGFYRYDDAKSCSFTNGKESSGCTCQVSGSGAFPWPDGYSMTCPGRGDKPFWAGY